MISIESVDDLESELSAPTSGVLETLSTISGDIVILGAAGKMGPTLTRMVRRGLDEIGHPSRRVIAASRFSNPRVAEDLQAQGVEVIRCNLLDRASVATLPDAPNVINMAGQKFGTSDAPELTWAMNTIVPAVVAERYQSSRVVVFSTACVYSLTAADGPGANENDPLTPPGEYANSCVGRERVFGYFAKQHGTRSLFYRLSYSIDLRYGVLRDVADKVFRGEPVDVSMGFANVIWQRDANARAIQCLAHAASPPVALNVTGMEKVSIRELAQQFGKRFGRPPIIVGQEGPTAWIFDARKSYELFGPPTMTLDEMIDATAHWVQRGGTSLGKPTHFEVRDGQF